MRSRLEPHEEQRARAEAKVWVQEWRRGTSALEDFLLYLAAGVAALLFGSVGLLWLTGQLAALWYAGQWPDLSLADTIGVLTRLVEHLDDPAAAWPPDAQPLPGVIGFYGTLLCVLAGAVAVLLGVITFTRRDRHPEPGKDAAAPPATPGASPSKLTSPRALRHRRRRWRQRQS